MRYLIYGAGAIGGTMGAALQLRGQDVALIARGPHLHTLQQRGMTFIAPGQQHLLTVNAVDSPHALNITDDDVVFMAMKSQHTLPALSALRVATDAEPAIVCAQNGVENERLALRLFAHVYGMEVVLPATHLEPGTVEVHSRNVFGLLDIGCFPGGVDERAERIAADLRDAGFSCDARGEIMAWKYRKLISNLGNGLQILIGDAAESRDIVRMLRGEATAVFAAASIAVAPDAEYRKRTDLLDRSISDVDRRVGSSTLQSLMRGTGNVETDYLNGEIVMLGRLHNVPTPVNALIQNLCTQYAATKQAPGAYSPTALLGRARAAVQAHNDHVSRAVELHAPTQATNSDSSTSRQESQQASLP